MECSMLGSPVIHHCQSLPKFMSTELVILFNHFIFCHLLLLLLQSFPATRAFPTSKLLTSGGQRIEASVSASVLPMNIQCWFPLGLTGLMSVQSKRLKSLLQHHNSKASILWCWVFFMVQLSHPYITTGKNIGLTRRTFGFCFLIHSLGLS